MLPDYFFTVAASSTGKYHPAYALGSGGLVRHTKAAVKFAHTLLGLEQYGCFSQDEKDIILSALMLHDGWKHGSEYSNFTVAEHPTVCAEWLKNTEELHGYLSDSNFEILTSGIASHMGEFCTDYKTKKQILPKPETDIQKFIHLCDYLASRKWLPVDFEGDCYDGSYKAVSEVDNTIASIITECKAKIADGVSRDNVYGAIQEVAGVKNPNKITDNAVAIAVLDKIKELVA